MINRQRLVKPTYGCCGANLMALLSAVHVRGTDFVKYSSHPRTHASRDQNAVTLLALC